jgi:hypothetical protein
MKPKRPSIWIDRYYAESNTSAFKSGIYDINNFQLSAPPLKKINQQVSNCSGYNANQKEIERIFPLDCRSFISPISC